MKILLVEPTGRNSHYHYVRALFDRLIQQNCQIDVLTASDFVHPHYLNHLHQLQEFPRFHWRLIGGFLRKWDRFVHITGNYLTVWSTIRRIKPDIVHFQVLHHPFLPLFWWAKRTTPFRLIYTPHNLEGHYRDKWLQNALNILFLKKCRRVIDGYVAHTPFHARGLLAMGIAPDKIAVIPYAPHMVGPVDHRLRDRYTVLFAGGIRRNKGIDDFLEALKILDQTLEGEQPSFRPTVIIAGQSRDLAVNNAIAAIKRDCARLDIVFENRFIPSDTFSQYFNRAQILVLPYTRNFKSLSAVLLDGYHYNNEIITTRAGANGETVEREGTGIAVEPGDPEVLAECLLELLKEGPNEARGRNRNQALENVYNWEHIADQALVFYRRITRKS